MGGTHNSPIIDLPGKNATAVAKNKKRWARPGRAHHSNPDKPVARSQGGLLLLMAVVAGALSGDRDRLGGADVDTRSAIAAGLVIHDGYVLRHRNGVQGARFHTFSTGRALVRVYYCWHRLNLS
jgi:hypothetical protein